MKRSPNTTNIQRRRLLGRSVRGVVIACAATLMGCQPSLVQATSQTNEATTMQLTQEWDKTFAKSDKVDHQKVTFENRYGITLAADLYLPKDRTGERLSALAVGGPFGAVKEQSSGLYAQNMAERGFVTLAFDPSHTGESGGEPRNVASPDINTEDFSAAVDFLGLHPAVDRARIGIPRSLALSTPMKPSLPHRRPRRWRTVVVFHRLEPAPSLHHRRLSAPAGARHGLALLAHCPGEDVARKRSGQPGGS